MLADLFWHMYSLRSRRSRLVEGTLSAGEWYFLTSGIIAHPFYQGYWSGKWRFGRSREDDENVQQQNASMWLTTRAGRAKLGSSSLFVETFIFTDYSKKGKKG